MVVTVTERSASAGVVNFFYSHQGVQAHVGGHDKIYYYLAAIRQCTFKL